MNPHSFANHWKSTDLSQTRTDIPFRWECIDLKHDNFTFAKSIYINAVFVELKEKTIKLNTEHFQYFEIDDFLEKDERIKNDSHPLFQNMINDSKESDTNKLSLYFSQGERKAYANKHNFQKYCLEGSIFPYRTKDKVFGISGEPPLYICSSLTFSHYSANPPHEFTGGLEATRFHPTIWIGTENENILSVRIDYRFHLHCDENSINEKFIPKPTAPWLDDRTTDQKYSINPVGMENNNHALIIRDADNMLGSMQLLLNISKQIRELYNATLSFFENSLKYNLKQSELFIALLNVPNIFKKKYWTKITDLVSEMLDAARLILENLGVILKNSLLIQFEIEQLKKQMLVDAIKLASIIDDVSLLVAVIIFRIIRIKNNFDDLIDLFNEKIDLLEELIALEIINKFWDSQTIKNAINTIVDKLKKNQENIDASIESIQTDFEAILALNVQIMGKISVFAGFERIEKPMLHEGIGYFIKDGQVSNTWDNMHWWGTQTLPSTPGAFHAIHQHFRWAQFITYPTKAQYDAVNELDYWLGSKKNNGVYKSPYSEFETGKTAALDLELHSFRSLVDSFKSKGVAGPLISPHLPNQTIAFAVVKNGDEVDQLLKTIKIEGQSELATFESIGNSNKAEEISRLISNTPENGEMFSGNDLVYWLSVNVKRENLQNPFMGTLLINGFYFGHEAEKPFSMIEATNFAANSVGIGIQNPDRGVKVPSLFR